MKKIFIILLTIILLGCMDKTDERGFYTSGEKKGYNKETKTLYDKEGYNKNGYNKEGYDKDGYDKNGYNKEGYNLEGYNKNGYNKEGYDKDGYDKNGYNKEGYNKYGFDKYGYNKEGYDKEGYGKYGYNKEGYNKYGYNKEGYNKDGYNVKKYDIKNKSKRKKYVKYFFENGINVEDELFYDFVSDFIQASNYRGYLAKKGEFEKTKDYEKRVKAFYNEEKKKKEFILSIFNKVPCIFVQKNDKLSYDADKEEWSVEIKKNKTRMSGDYDEDYVTKYAHHPEYGIYYEVIFNEKNNIKYYEIPMSIDEAKIRKGKINTEIKYIFKITDFSKKEVSVSYKTKKYYYPSGNFKLPRSRGSYYSSEKVEEYWTSKKENLYKFNTEILGYQILLDGKIIKEVIF